MFENLKQGIVALVFLGIVAGALALALDGFQNGMSEAQICWNDTHYYNETSGYCMPNSTTTNTSLFPTPFSHAYNISEGGLAGVQNATDYLDTIGTLLGVAALIGIVVYGFYKVVK